MPEESPKGEDPTDRFCSKVPGLVSRFVDTFVDFTVGGQVLGDPVSAGSKTRAADASVTGNAAAKENSQDNLTGDADAPLTANAVNGEDVRHFTRLPPVERLVAIGDIHGDLGKAREALRLAGVINEEDRWIGEKTTVVQVGDLLDRGGQELKVIYLLEKLKLEARRDGGDVIIMNGNHEVMNMEGDFTYATKAALDEFQSWGKWYRMGQVLKERCEGLGEQPDAFKNIKKNIPEGLRARYAALRPGGPISARFLAPHPTVLVVGSTVFAHGGILPSHVDYGLDKINAETREWMRGSKGRRAPSYLREKNAVVWARQYSLPSELLCDCKLLNQALAAIDGAERMVVGHTIQAPWGINGACKDRVIRVDVGMSKGCGNASPEVLEIRNDRDIRILSRTSPSRGLKDHVLPGLASLLA